MSLACLRYTSYLVSTSYDRPLYEAVAAFLPCIWLYWEIAWLLKDSCCGKYRSWFESNASPEFTKNVQSYLDLIETIAAKLDENSKAKLDTHFLNCCQMEYSFWDAAYNYKRWEELLSISN